MEHFIAQQERPEDDPTPPGGVTPQYSDDASDLRSELLRSRLLQLYLAKVMVPNPNNDNDECSSMRVEDDEADYNDRHSLFDRSPDVDHRSLRSPEPRARRDLTVSPVSTFEDEEEEEIDEESELPIIVKRRQRVDRRRFSLDSAPSAPLHDVFDKKPSSNRVLEVQRIARYLESDRRCSLDASKNRTESILEGGDLAVSKEQRQWLEADLHSARVAAWRSELGLRQQISRRGSLHDENAVLTFSCLSKGLPVKTPSMPEKLQPTSASPSHFPDSVSTPPLCPTPQAMPKSTPGESAIQTELKRREINVYAPVSF